VSLNPGSYNVTINNATSGYAPSYSTGCSGTMVAGQTQLCVITMTPNYTYGNQYNNYPYNYNYPYIQPLTCQTLTPTVALGQTATFQAVGGAGGTFNWSTAYQNYPNIGRVLNTTFQASGVQTVTVTNAAQTATCSITVNANYNPVPTPNYPIYPGTTYPTYPNYPTYPGTTYPAYGTTYGNTYTYPTIYPQLPRTGFGPRDLTTGAAFAAVLLIAAGLAVTPYVRRTFAAISR
jgi:hypothetical protein